MPLVTATEQIVYGPGRDVNEAWGGNILATHVLHVRKLPLFIGTHFTPVLPNISTSDSTLFSLIVTVIYGSFFGANNTPTNFVDDSVQRNTGLRLPLLPIDLNSVMSKAATLSTGKECEAMDSRKRNDNASEKRGKN